MVSITLILLDIVPFTTRFILHIFSTVFSLPKHIAHHHVLISIILDLKNLRLFSPEKESFFQGIWTASSKFYPIFAPKNEQNRE